ncbi:uncharacterized protein LTHEOB_11184 [Neofusicoccum parvum]|uniref:Uncharacterized protein LTHEOB_11184 n=1 Tax=Neofusicoccum parvum TaxID=310453 RepID=A0ACB5S329_9PEZI|nr:uncharacterized protein LTHEOB_11184 [Neofusicoccum parvum]
MDQAQETQPDGNSATLPARNEMDIDPPTKESNDAYDAPMHKPERSTPDDTAHGDEDAKPTTDDSLEKPQMPAWMTDPAGKAIITVIPSIDRHEQAHIVQSQQPRQDSQQQQQENSSIGAGSSDQVLQRPMTGPPQAIRPEPHYIVIVQYAPSVVYGGSEFIFLQQDNYPQTGQFETIDHFTKAFVRLTDAKHHALHLFTQRVSTDYRYVMQKAWEDLTPQEIRELGVSQDGPSPHVRGFVFKLIDERRVWQIRFGCDEEFCRISVLPVPPGDPRLEGLVLVGPGEKHGRTPKSPEVERPPAEMMSEETATDTTIREETTAKEAESEETAPEDSSLVESMTENMLPAEIVTGKATAERT